MCGAIVSQVAEWFAGGVAGGIVIYLGFAEGHLHSRWHIVRMCRDWYVRLPLFNWVRVVVVRVFHSEADTVARDIHVEDTHAYTFTSRDHVGRVIHVHGREFGHMNEAVSFCPDIYEGTELCYAADAPFHDLPFEQVLQFFSRDQGLPRHASGQTYSSSVFIYVAYPNDNTLTDLQHIFQSLDKALTDLRNVEQPITFRPDIYKRAIRLQVADNPLALHSILKLSQW